MTKIRSWSNAPFRLLKGEKKMPSFLKEIEAFRGTGEKNAAGQTLEEFLEAYNPRKYETPSCTTDAVIFAYEEAPEKSIVANELKLLLVKRSNHPSIGFWALPGGFANMQENLDVTAKRELQEETGVEGLRMEQIATYGKMARDPRTRVITTAYMALVKESDVCVKAGDDAADAGWFEISLEKIETQENKESIVERYCLRGECREKNVSIKAIVKHTQTKGLIREWDFEVEDGGCIAVDHAAIVVHAMTILQKRIK